MNWNSTTARAEASRAFHRHECLSLLRPPVSQLPTPELVVDYFLWRAEDPQRNALNACCCWLLRRDGLKAQAVTAQLLSLPV